MKGIKVICAVAIVTTASFGELVRLEGASAILTTGDLLDEADHNGRTTNVVEIAGLQITARSGGPTQDVNSLTDSMGIDTDGTGDDSDAIEGNEKLILSFDRDVQINQFDFNQFSSGEVAYVSITGMPAIVISHENQSNGISDTLNTNILVEANTEIEFYVTDASSFGLDGIDITLLQGSEFQLLLTTTNSKPTVSAVFGEAATTNYILQSSTNLASNDWETISVPFSTNSEWEIETTNSSGFYRAIPD